MNRYRPWMKLSALLVALLLCGGLHAQINIPPGPPAGALRRNLLNDSSANSDPVGSVPEGGIVRLPPGWGDQLKMMQPAEQERFLRNSERFRSLSPEQQALIRRRLRVWNNLPLEKREAVLERQQIWETLPPAQRRRVRESILPRWQTLPVLRRQAILRKLRELRALDGAQRNARLNDGSFLSGMNDEDRRMLRDLAALGGGSDAG